MSSFALGKQSMAMHTPDFGKSLHDVKSSFLRPAFLPDTYFALAQSKKQAETLHDVVFTMRGRGAVVAHRAGGGALTPPPLSAPVFYTLPDIPPGKGAGYADYLRTRTSVFRICSSVSYPSQ